MVQNYINEQVAQGYFQNNAPAFVLEVFCATCTPVYVILYHVTGSCKGPIQGPIMICTFLDMTSVAPALLSLPAKLLFVCLFVHFFYSILHK